jgi:hypothetical protein
MTRAKNAGNIIMKNLMDFCIGTPAFWILGFGLMFGVTKDGTCFRSLESPTCSYAGSTELKAPIHLRLSDLPDGVLRDGGDHRLRSHGGTDQVQRILPVLVLDQLGRLSDQRPLDLGWWLACSAWVP